MDDRPVTRYAKSPDGVSLAYQITGDGPFDLVFLLALGMSIDLLWEDAGFAHVVKRLRGFSRSVWCEGRGLGASGGDLFDAFIEEIADADATAVLDATECAQVVLVGAGGGGAMAVHYATTHPERVAALVLINTFAHYISEEDYPWGLPLDALERIAAAQGEQWGTGAGLEVVAPSKAGDDGFRAFYARASRLGVGADRSARWALASARRDVRPLLATLAVPTLVLHREGDRFIRVGAGRYLAEHIPGAKYVELPGGDHLFFVGDTDALLDEIEEFLTGSHQAPEGDLVNATILFTDIVASTAQSARVGHRRWRTLIDAHDAMVRATLQRHRGREVKTTGDGFLATFDATTRAVRAGTDIVAAAKGIGLDVRAAVHTGEVEVRPDDVVGLAVGIAKRICDLAGPGEVLVSEAVRILIVGSGIATSERGTHILKGVPDMWRLFAVESR